jgi:homeobox protein Unc-4
VIGPRVPWTNSNPPKSHHLSRAKKRKKITKAIERQARKLRAKGIAVDVEALRNEYISQHRGQLINSSDSEDDDNEDPIDVVGGTDGTDEESQDCHSHQKGSDSVEHIISYSSNSNDTSKHSIRPNPFSIENILFRST